jgi:glycosyltransferase involved in cell wall biosynthesis
MGRLNNGPQKMNLIYYYPMDKGSPSNVSRRILTELVNNIDSLPFNEIILFSKPKDVNAIKGSIKEKSYVPRVISYKELNKISGDYLVHFPILPTILPNSKFLLYLCSKFLMRKKIIIQYHGDVRTELKSSYKDIRSLIHILSYILIPDLLKSADMVITPSYYMDTIIKKYGVSKSTVIPNAIDDFWFQHNNEVKHLKKVIDKNVFNIFYHGRLSSEKGVDILLEAVGNYIKDNPRVAVYIAGEGPQKTYLKKLCSELNIDKNVIFMGNICKDEIIAFLKSVDVAIYPSKFDNFPLAVLEALACANCPVYFSKNIGIYDFVIQEGFKLNYFELNVTSLTKVLDSAFQNTNKNIVNQQIQFARNYTWDRVIVKYIDLYKNIIKE